MSPEGYHLVFSPDKPEIVIKKIVKQTCWVTITGKFACMVQIYKTSFLSAMKKAHQLFLFAMVILEKLSITKMSLIVKKKVVERLEILFI